MSKASRQCVSCPVALAKLPFQVAATACFLLLVLLLRFAYKRGLGHVASQAGQVEKKDDALRQSFRQVGNRNHPTSSSATSAASSSSSSAGEQQLSLQQRALTGLVAVLRRCDVIQHMDRGMLKVLWATAQILSLISPNLAVEFPEPFDSFLETLSMSAGDMVGVSCLLNTESFVDKVIVLSLAPLLFWFLDLLVFGIRLWRPWHCHHRNPHRPPLSQQAAASANDEPSYDGSRQRLASRLVALGRRLSIVAGGGASQEHDSSFSSSSGGGGALEAAATAAAAEATAKESNKEERARQLASSHMYYALVAAYASLPLVAQALFAALDCQG